MSTPTLAPRRLPPGETAGRRTLRAQVGRLELRLAALTADLPFASDAPSGGPRILSLGDLEESRDALLTAIATAERALTARERERAVQRRKLQRMLDDPRRHRFARVRLADIGAPGCGAYTVVPRLGLLGMLAGWWEVRLSSGCP